MVGTILGLRFAPLPQTPCDAIHIDINNIACFYHTLQGAAWPESYTCRSCRTVSVLKPGKQPAPPSGQMSNDKTAETDRNKNDDGDVAIERIRLRRQLSVYDGIAIVCGAVVGGSVFITPQAVLLVPYTCAPRG